MDLPPSGWYPDPYGKPRLLRWWDGSVWTQHTHPDISPGGPGAAGDPGAAAGVQSTAVQAAVVPATAVQAAVLPASGLPATVVQAAVPATAVQAAVPATAVQAAARQPANGWRSAIPSDSVLRRTRPPTGQPTQPQ